MSKYPVGFVAMACAVAVSAFGQSLRLGMNSNNLNVYGHTNAYGRLEKSYDLQAWAPTGTVFHVYTDLSLPCDNSQGHQFFRSLAAPSNWVSINNSIEDNCAEHDNVSVIFVGRVTNFSVIATHPSFTPANYDCNENFDNCTPGTNIDYFFPAPQVWTIQYGGGWSRLHRNSSFWRPQGMDFYINGVNQGATNTHLFEIAKTIPGSTEAPIFFAIYSDGYVRLIAFPPVGQPDICMGASVIIGPSEPSERPYADISAIDFRTTNSTLLVTYRAGGTALIDYGNVSRTSASLKVSVNYPTDKPFCTIRTMFVSNGNSDCDSIIWKNGSTTTTNNIMDFRGDSGTNWFFCRRFHSIQRDSAPDIRITF